MSSEEFEHFKTAYLERFRKYYKSSRTSKKELKRSVFDNNNLSDGQKKEFWNLVINKDLVFRKVEY